MNYIDLKISVPVDKLSQSAAIAQMIAAHGLYIEDYSHLEEEVEEIAHISMIDKSLSAKDRHHAVIHLYFSEETVLKKSLSYLKQHLKKENISFTIDANIQKEENWAFKWQQYYHPTNIGKRLLICPSWEEVPADHRIKILMDPGLAFGTGTHETTRASLTLLEEIIRPSMKVLDIGCGSGILSIAAVKLGASQAIGVDIDPLAVKTAGQNAQINQIGDQISFIQGDLFKNVHGKFDLICANIVASVILSLLNNIKDHLYANSYFLCSGILLPQAQEIKDALQSHGFQIVKIIEDNDWAAILSQYQRSDGSMPT